MSCAVAIGSAAFERLLSTTNLYVSMLLELAEDVRDNEPTNADLLQKYAVTTAANARDLMNEWSYLFVRENGQASDSRAASKFT